MISMDRQSFDALAGDRQLFDGERQFIDGGGEGGIELESHRGCTSGSLDLRTTPIL